MQSGVINSENVSQVLRQISQRRQQGVLEISSGGSTHNVSFISGKVVDVQEGTSGPEQLYHALVDGGLCQEGTTSFPDSYSELYTTLESEGVFKRAVEEEEFRNILRQQILDRLYSIEFQQGVFYQFRVQMVEVDKDLAPSISIGQLLLDLVSLDSEEERFQKAFPIGAKVEAVDQAVHSFSEEELKLLTILAYGSCDVDLLKRKSLLSRYHFQEALLSLFEQDCLLVELPGSSMPADGGTPAGASSGVVPGGGDPLAEAEALLSELGPVRVPGEAKEEEGEEAEAQSGKVSPVPNNFGLGVLNARLLQASWVIHTLTVLFVMSLLVLPFFSWSIF